MSIVLKAQRPVDKQQLVPLGNRLDVDMLISLGYTLHQDVITLSDICVASSQPVARLHPSTCTEALTNSMVYHELVRALCEEAMGSVSGYVQFHRMSKGSDSIWPALYKDEVVTVYFKTVSRFVCKRFTKPGIGL
jgi:hypothetical protein